VAGETSEPPIFDLALRGYRRQDVDSYLARLDSYLSQLRSGRAVGPLPEPAAFDIALRGYDRAQVDEFIAATLDEGRSLQAEPGPDAG
jgi:cell division septum initiation protein DivIVA